MNRKVRTEVEELVEDLKDKRATFSAILDREKEGLENIPENLRGSERSLKKEEEVESLESVLFTMDELIEGFDSLLEG